MTNPTSSYATRRAALSLLAEGNGVESVAHVLGVPVGVVEAWQRGEQVDWTAGDATGPSTAPATHVHIHDADVVHAAPAGERRMAIGGGLFMVAVAVSLAFTVGLQHRPDGISFLWLACLPLACGGVSLVAQSRARFLFGETEMTQQRAWSTRRLAYADIAQTTVATDTISAGKGSRTKGLRVTIASRLFDAPSLSLFIADTGPRPVDVIARVRALPGATAAELALFDRPRPATVAPSLVAMVVVISMVIVACCVLLKDPEMGLSGIFHGLPRFEELERVDGVVTGSSECPSRKPFKQDVALRFDGGGTATRSIPCVLDDAPLADGHSHRMTIRADMYDRVYQVELDGQPLLRYGAVKTQDFAWRAFRALIVLMLTAGPLLLIRSFWRRLNATRD